VFERFTDRARRVVVLAQEESRLLNHKYIGTEHILLGLLREAEGVAARALEAMGISLEEVRSRVEAIIGHGVDAPTGHIPFTPRAKKVLELSLREALQLKHNYIGTEHLLLGLIRESEGVAAQVLVSMGAELERVKQEVLNLLSGPAGSREVRAGTVRRMVAGLGRRSPEEAAGEPPTCPHCGASLIESAACMTTSIQGPEDNQERSVTFVYCTNCGHSLGLLGEGPSS
jgi:ATP-dependent Clp protease ATP-binding subunit ClpC